LQFNKSIENYILGFEEQLPILPKGIDALLPYATPEVWVLAQKFYQKYYSDSSERSLILGINPGRNGAGLTGVPFTDSKRLEEKCMIKTDLKSHEPSSEFIYHMIEAFGGPDLFYKKFFISSVSPIGFIKKGKNYNYYDEPGLINILSPYIYYQMNRLLQLRLKKKKIICLGEGKNFKFLSELNSKHHWFEEIIPLAHPRYIMQYKRRQLNYYIDQYIKALNAIL
jgi:hypothetical protein